MQSRIGLLLILPPRWFRWSGLRWPASVLSAMLAVLYALLLWQAHYMFVRYGVSASLRASVWQTFAPVLAAFGATLALGLWASLSSWAAWNRERRAASAVELGRWA